MEHSPIYMQRALELAMAGFGKVNPNPLVGCVIVHNDIIIGEGYHQEYGKAHGEVIAIQSVKDKSLLSESTLYVTLEPCSHFGKTPPCADFIIENKIPKVVIANVDPNPLVSGSGIKKMTQAGIEVIAGILFEQGEDLNKRFFTFQRKQRPYIILKWAQSADGFLGGNDKETQWISNSYSRKAVHRWRSEEAAVLVGYQTAAIDDPQLNVRDWAGKNPLRIVIDPHLELSKTLHLFDQSLATIVYNNETTEAEGVVLYVKAVSLKEILTDLYQRNILSVIVEGGAKTLQRFLDENLWDEARVFTATHELKEGTKAPRIQQDSHASIDMMGDLLETFENKSAASF